MPGLRPEPFIEERDTQTVPIRITQAVSNTQKRVISKQGLDEQFWTARVFAPAVISAQATRDRRLIHNRGHGLIKSNL